MTSRSASQTGQISTSKTLDPDVRRGQWLKGVLELCLLGLLHDGEAYGYELAQHLEQAGLGAVKGGTLYPRLAALETAGVVETEWREGDNGPGRKYYLITPLGRSTLAEAADEYERFTTVAQHLIRGAHGTVTSSSSGTSTSTSHDQHTTGVTSGQSY